MSLMFNGVLGALNAQAAYREFLKLGTAASTEWTVFWLCLNTIVAIWCFWDFFVEILEN